MELKEQWEREENQCEVLNMPALHTITLFFFIFFYPQTWKYKSNKMDERDKAIFTKNQEYIAKTLASSGKAQDVVYELRECQVLSTEHADMLLVSVKQITFSYSVFVMFATVLEWQLQYIASALGSS